jgi:hypothetical protein
MDTQKTCFERFNCKTLWRKIMTSIVNRKNLNNPALQRMPESQRDWSQYQNELNRIITGSFTPTFSGFSGTPTAGDVVWRIQNGFAIVRIPSISGTSNAATFLITNWPQDIHCLEPTSLIIGGFVDGGSDATEFGWATIPQHPETGAGSGLMGFGLGVDGYGGGGFTTSLTKGIAGGVTTLVYAIDVG